MRWSLNSAFAVSKSKSASNSKDATLEFFAKSWPRLLVLDLRLAENNHQSQFKYERVKLIVWNMHFLLSFSSHFVGKPWKQLLCLFYLNEFHLQALNKTTLFLSCLLSVSTLALYLSLSWLWYCSTWEENKIKIQLCLTPKQKFGLSLFKFEILRVSGIIFFFTM